jgi:hypothetical protein
MINGFFNGIYNTNNNDFSLAVVCRLLVGILSHNMEASVKGGVSYSICDGWSYGCLG